MIKNKRGQMTAATVVGIVLAVIGFVVVLSLFQLFDIGGISEDEICELSVLSRASVGSLAGVAQGFVPLNCQTKKICITDEFFGECDEFVIEDDIQRVRLSGSDASKARQIEKVHADSQLNCWNLMQQGKLDLFGDFYSELGLKQGQSTCVICSRVAVADDVSQSVLDLVDINTYMETTTVVEDKTYAEVFTGVRATKFPEVEDVRESEHSEIPVPAAAQRDEINADLLDLSSGSTEKAYVFSQIKPENYENVFSKIGLTGVVAVGGGSFIPVIGPTVTAWVIVPGLVVTSAVAGYNVDAGQQAAAAYCGSFQSGAGAEENGCSLVQGVPYDFRFVNKMCNSIQGLQ